MGCFGSKHHEGEQVLIQSPNAYSLPQEAIPPSTLPPGWISQYDLNKQRLYYIYPQTAHVTWSHPLGSAADTQELERFHQIQQLQKEQYGESNHGAFTKAYNHQGGMGKNAAIAMGLMAGGVMGVMAGNMVGGVEAAFAAGEEMPALKDPTDDTAPTHFVYSGGEFIQSNAKSDDGGIGVGNTNTGDSAAFD
ncbi:hypothetical protein BGX34_009031 [Mortierella sp. NVP85]|nr:hypothetical protein BGX34_009031 [Mortierella sp. NVP85]